MERKAIESFIADCRMIELTPAIQDLTIEIRQRTNLKLADAAIAATAKYMGVQLVTADRAFLSIKDEIALLLVER